MKKLLIVVFVLLVSATASAQTITGFAEGQFHVGPSTTSIVDPTLDVALSHNVKNGWSVEAWALKCDGWGEFYIGAGKSLASWISITGQVGIEQADSPWRIAGSTFMSGRKMSLLVIYEQGGSGSWHKVVATREIQMDNDTIKIGFMSQRFIGTGPYVELPAVHKVKVWLTIPVVGGHGALMGFKVDL